MKKNLGPLLALYPMPLAIIGAFNGDKPTWTLVAHMGIIGHDHLLVSLASSHFINKAIKEKKRLSINLVDETMLPEADLAGFLSGNKSDKSELFAFETGVNGTPLVLQSPLSIECTVEDIYLTKGFESFICTIDATYVDEEKLGNDGKIDYEKLKPVLFEFPTYSYLSSGHILGKCLSLKKEKQ